MSESRLESFWRNWIYVPLVGGLALLAGTKLPSVPSNSRAQTAISTKSEKADNKPDGTGADPFIPANKGLGSFPARPFDDPFEHREEFLKGGIVDRPANTQNVRDVLSEYVDEAAKVDSPRLLVVAALVRGSDFPEDKQDRIEKRHAIELALAASGFRMSFPDRLSYAVVPNVVVKADIRKGAETRIEDHATMVHDKVVVPLKVYDSLDHQKKAVVLWIDERMTENLPLAVIRQLIQNLFSSGNGPKPVQKYAALAILGPTFSESLQKMIDTADVEKNHQAFWRWRHGAAIFNYSCTTELHWPSGTPRVLMRDERGVNLRVVHAIGTDEELVDSLCQELQRRGLLDAPVFWPRRVVLFVEQDIGSTKHLAELFQKHAPDVSLEVVPFLRGISDRRDGGGNDASTELVSDYLVRALEHLRGGSGNLKSRLSDVNLVGVLSSSVNDKIAIIESARELFPNAAMFTVDMASEYENANAHPKMRNTIVASHYGLSIDGQLFSSRPHFRSAYQTSAFVASTIALKTFLLSKEGLAGSESRLRDAADQDLYDLWHRDRPDTQDPVKPATRLRPRVAEISNFGAVVFRDSVRPTSTLLVQQPQSGADLRNTWPLLLCMLVLFGLTCGVLRLGANYSDELKTFWEYVDALMRSRKPQPASPAAVGGAVRRSEPAKTLQIGLIKPLVVVTAIALLLLLLIAGYEHHRALGEPFSFTTGISIWPSVILFALVTAAIVYWIVKGSAFRTEEARRDIKSAVILASLMLLATIAVAIATGSIGDPPGRSWVSRWVAWIFESTCCCLLFFVASHVSLRCFRLRQAISDFRANAPVIPLSASAAKLRMDKIFDFAQDSEVLSRYLLFPSFLAAVYAIARLPIWDAWLLNVVSYSSLLVPFVLAVASYSTVRYAAWGLRRKFVREIDESLLASSPCGNRVPNANDQSTLKEVKEMAAKLDVGAFASLSFDPFLGSIVLLFTTFATGPFQGVWSSVLGLFGVGR